MNRKPKNKKIIFGDSILLFHMIGMRLIPTSGTRGTPHDCLTHCVQTHQCDCPDNHRLVHTNCSNTPHDVYPSISLTSFFGQSNSWPQAHERLAKGRSSPFDSPAWAIPLPSLATLDSPRLSDITRFACLYLFLKMFEYSNKGFIYE